MNTLVFVLVNYFKEKELTTFVCNFLFPQEHTNYIIYIVDNGSHNPIELISLQENSRVRILQPGQNVGYCGAAFLAFQDFIEKNNQQLPSAFVLSNFDVSFDNFNFLRMISEAVDEGKAEIIGPQLISSLSHVALNPMYRERLPLSHIDRLIKVTSSYPLYYVYQLLHYAKRAMSKNLAQKSEQDEFTYAIHGSMMIFSEAFFKKGGTLDYPSFLYGEEIFVAEQAKKLGLKTLVSARLQVTHHEHATTGNMKNRMHMQYLHASLSYLKKAFYHE
jgi:GT2 family glycosyltransferase